MVQRPGAVGLAVVVCAVAGGQPAAAVVVGHNVNYAVVNQNPWSEGPAFQQEWVFDQLKTNFKLDLPKLNGDPINILADFLGIDLPIGAGVSVGGTVQGNFGLDLGYYVSGGKLHVKYPGRAILDIPTGAGNVVQRGQTISLNTNYIPGLSQKFEATTAAVASIAGLGYAQTGPLAPVTTFDTFENPEFSTTFPYASAWADVHYDVKAGAFVEAEALFWSARKDFLFGDARTVTLVEVDPSGIRVLGADPVQLFDQEIPLGAGTVKISYPNLKVASDPFTPGQPQLHGFDAKPILTLSGSLEKLVPFIGPFLSNSIGPIGYELLAVEGGPTLNLYQDFTLTPQNRVQLNFSEAVMVKGSDGIFRPTYQTEFNLGDDIEIRPILGFAPEIQVQATYLMGHDFRNETGISLGAVVDVRALSLMTPLGDLGPAFTTQLVFNDLARVPLYNNTFDLPVKQIVAAPITLDAVVPRDQFSSPLHLIIESVSFVPLGDTASFSVSIRNLETDFLYNFLTPATPVSFLAPDGSEQFLLVAPQDLFYAETINGMDVLLNLGREFLFAGFDGSAFFNPVSPFLEDDQGNPLLYLASLHEFASGEVDVENDPRLGQNNFRDIHEPFPTVIGPTVVVPETATSTLLLSGLMTLAAATRRRHRVGPEPAQSNQSMRRS